MKYEFRSKGALGRSGCKGQGLVKRVMPKDVRMRPRRRRRGNFTAANRGSLTSPTNIQMRSTGSVPDRVSGKPRGAGARHTGQGAGAVN